MADADILTVDPRTHPWLGISYTAEEPPSPTVYGAAVAKAAKDLGLTLVLEPSRVIVGNAGVLLTRVLLKKNQGAKKFLVVDAGMNDLIKPALYGSHHQLWSERARAEKETVDVVGPVCPPTLSQKTENFPYCSRENWSPS